MIVKPSSAIMVSVVRSELKNLSDELAHDQRVRLGMIDSVLNAVQVRISNEIYWMFIEIQEIENFASRIQYDRATSDLEIDAAWEALKAGRHTSLRAEDVANEYDLASRLLSVCIERSLEAGGELRKQAELLLSRRVSREIEIRGNFSLLGRT